MIRINLLDSVSTEGGIHAALNPGGASTFISKREVLLGGAFLLLGAVILGAIVFVGPTSDPGQEPAPQETPVIASLPDSSSPDADEEQAPAPDEAPIADEEPPLINANAEIVVGNADSEESSDEEEQPAPVAEAEEPAKPAPATPAPNPREQAAVRKAAPQAPAGPVARLTDLEVESLGSQLRIFLSVDGECEVSTFNLSNPGRVVVDLQPARLDMGTKTVDVGHRLLQRVRIAQNQLNPPKVRLVMDAANEFPDMIIVDRSGGFEFTVTPDQ